MSHCSVFAVLIMGFSESEARLGLRACQGDTTSAVDYITQKRQVNKKNQDLLVQPHLINFRRGVVNEIIAIANLENRRSGC